MSFLSRLVTLFGLALLAHAGYSAHEHTVLFSNASISAVATLPQDIIAETLISVLVVSIGLVLSAEKLKPISWRDWAGQIERDGGARNPYIGLEERYSFWDIRAKRKEFADWVRGPNEAVKQ
ncbi:Magnesium transporter [Penicillium malachiteum]|nr:Magnesium transporter [Penicillium malachiteum]